MKTTQTVNIGGRAFIMDDDAYVKLSKYLEAIEMYYTNTNDRKEIMEDIEARIAEIFSENNRNQKKVITIREVEKMIQIMGHPEDFKEETAYKERKQTFRDKRLYRDPDDRMLGGVCSGIAAYFNTDPGIIRILFLLTFFLLGFGLIVYIILWIIIPEAKTEEQKQEMEGSPPNYDHMKGFVKQEYEQVKNNFKNRYGKSGKYSSYEC